VAMVRVGSLFSGIGGLDVGFEDAGCDVRWAIEYYKPSAQVFAANFPSAQTICADIRSVDAAELEPIDVLIGGFPCDPFSVANKRRKPGHDPVKQTLYLEVLRFVREHQPRLVVLENVPGLLSFAGGEIVRDMREKMEALGYDIHVHILDLFEHAGRPMRRKRLFFTATRERLALYPQFPKVGLQKRLGEFAEDIPLEHELRELRGKVARAAPTMPPVQPGRFLKKKTYGKLSFTDERQWRVTDVANTWLSADCGKACAYQTFIGDSYGWRRMSYREVARMMGFPDDWDWATMTESQRERALGQCVAPAVARLVADGLVAHLLQTA